MVDLQLTVHDVQPAAFIEVCGAFLARHEAQHSLILAVAGRIRDLPSGAGEAYAVEVRRGVATTLVALRTPPMHLLLSSTEDVAAVDALAMHVVRSDALLFGVNGPAATARRFATTWSTLTGSRAALDLRLRVLRLDRVIPPSAPPPGAARFATSRDLQPLASWVEAFRAEALPNEPASRRGADVVAGWLSRSQPVAWVWESGGEVVSMAIAGHKTLTGVRISGVYTPPAHRGRGYARALVAAASQGALDRGRSMCVLDADVTNGTATRLYESVGYVPVANVEVYRFVPMMRREL